MIISKEKFLFVANLLLCASIMPSIAHAQFSLNGLVDGVVDAAVKGLVGPAGGSAQTAPKASPAKPPAHSAVKPSSSRSGAHASASASTKSVAVGGSGPIAAATVSKPSFKGGDPRVTVPTDVKTTVERGFTIVTGSLINQSEETLGRVSLTFVMYDKENSALGNVGSSIEDLAPKAKWKFRFVFLGKAASASLSKLSVQDAD